MANNVPNPGLAKNPPANRGSNARAVNLPQPVKPAPTSSFADFKAALPLLPPSHIVFQGPRKSYFG